MIAPRHPERFDAVAKMLGQSGFSFVRRSDQPSEHDRSSDVILLDSIGELRSAYPLAEIVFVGGSLVPHGGQSILEPAAEGKAIVTGPHTANFDAVVKGFLENDAILQTPASNFDYEIVERLGEAFDDLLRNEERRRELGANAADVVSSNQDATRTTIGQLKRLGP
jgi:3-deoxy-D-manno-octulosonic-acid transferase